MKTFLDVMNNASSVEDFKFAPLPAGEYEAIIKKINPEKELGFDFGDVPAGTPIVEIYLSPVRALDVEEEELDQCSDWEEKLLSISLITPGDAAKLADVANEKGLVFDAGLSFDDYFTDGEPDFDTLWKDLTGKKVGVQVVHRVSKKSGATMANVKKTFPLD